MPQEIEAFYLLPAIRRELVIGLLKAGLSQRQIAEKLGITEAAVSQYMKGKRAAGKIRFDGKVEEEIKKAVDRILKNSDVMEELHCICNVCKEEMVLCRIHRAEGKVPENCKLCLKGD